MAEPPEKKFKIEAVEKAHRIIRNSVVVPAIPISSESTAVSVSVRAGYYLTANGQWRKKPTPRSYVFEGCFFDLYGFGPAVLYMCIC
jgi:hypothetical protein